LAIPVYRAKGLLINHYYGLEAGHCPGHGTEKAGRRFFPPFLRCPAGSNPAGSRERGATDNPRREAVASGQIGGVANQIKTPNGGNN